MKQLSAAFLCFLVAPALAGGDYVWGKITSFAGDSGSYPFQFTQTDRHSSELMPGCREFDVAVEYHRVPWWSWLPFAVTGHPTRQETEEAAAFLRAARTSSQAVLFGYMGHGLISNGKHCSFLSRGLSLSKEQGKHFVLSYHDQT